ncbi:MAG: hypothetical protein LAO05_06260 [Acidobacteriia bacterium]|nr:hypothetical protein [Terriglobia bacterium]
MAGPVWRFVTDKEGVCDSCLRRSRGMYVEGEVTDNELRAVRALCRTCAEDVKGLVVSGETAGRAVAPAYAHNAGS